MGNFQLSNRYLLIDGIWLSSSNNHQVYPVCITELAMNHYADHYITVDKSSVNF